MRKQPRYTAEHAQAGLDVKLPEIETWPNQFPGYEIVGVDHGGTNWNDSVHCRTRNFVKREAIRIYPYPPGDTEDRFGGYTVTAEVIPPKGNALISGYPVIHWTDTGRRPSPTWS